jgi:hypothetical protein
MKVIMKFTIDRAMKTQRGSRGIALLFLDLGAAKVWAINATLRSPYPRGRHSVLILKEAVGASGLV